MSDRVNGSVLVVGGGIAGMQSAWISPAPGITSISWKKDLPLVGHGGAGQDLPTNDCAM